MVNSCDNIEIGICTVEYLLSLEPQELAIHVLLSNIYDASGKWHRRARLSKVMKDKGVRKEVGCSWIDVNYKVHTFVLDGRLQAKGIQIISSTND